MIHIEKYHINEFDNPDEDSVSISWCWIRATLHVDGTVSPRGYNFVTRHWPQNSDCEECRDAYYANQNL